MLNTAVSADYSLTAKAWQKDWFSLKAAECFRKSYWICKISTTSFHLSYESLFENFILNTFKKRTQYIGIKHFRMHSKALLQGLFGSLWIYTHHLKTQNCHLPWKCSLNQINRWLYFIKFQASNNRHWKCKKMSLQHFIILRDKLCLYGHNYNVVTMCIETPTRTIMSVLRENRILAVRTFINRKGRERSEYKKTCPI